MAENEHGKLIASAAKAILAPLGFVRKGRSRVWIADQRFWLIVVEFQPSGFSKGSYLNVAASWLWRPFGALTFNYPHPNRPWVSFENAAQFAAAMEQMALEASNAVLTIRIQLGSLRDIDAHLQGCSSHERANLRDFFHAAVTAGLLGEIQQSRSLFDRLAARPAEHDWQRELQQDGAALAVELEEPVRFRAAALDLIQRARTALGLAEDRGCLDGQLGPDVEA